MRFTAGNGAHKNAALSADGKGRIGVFSSFAAMAAVLPAGFLTVACASVGASDAGFPAFLGPVNEKPGAA